MKKRLKYIFLFLGIVISLSFIFTGIYLIKDSGLIMNRQLDGNISEISGRCKNLSIFKSADCIVRQTKFKYNISNIGKDLDFETFKREGGVCQHFSEFYCMLGEELGFYATIPKIPAGYENLTFKGKYGNYPMKHSFCIWSNGEGWVVLDQQAIFKFKFENISVE